MAPPAFSVRNANGNFTDLSPLGNYSNPAAKHEYLKDDRTKGVRLIGNVYAELYLMKDLTFRSSFGIDGNRTQNRKFVPQYNVGGSQKKDVSDLTRKWENKQDYYWDNTLNYHLEVNDDHRFNFMAGLSVQEHSSLWMDGKALDINASTDNTWYLTNGSSDGRFANDGGDKYCAFSYFGRVSYTLKNRYLLTATMRSDASSKFPKNNRTGYFSSLGLGWIITNEGFMENQKAFNNLKLRASWGKLGNSNIPSSTAQQLLSVGGKESVIMGGVIHNGANITIVAPKNLKWEVVNEYDIALEGSTFNSRLNFEIDYYYRKTTNAIFLVTVNPILGASNTTFLDNNADILNRGIEVSLKWRDNFGDFNYRNCQ